MKPRRLLPPGMVGNLVAPDRALVPVGECGWLTPIKGAASGGGFWSFRCRCNTVVSRLARNVIRAVRDGGVPRCSASCAWRAGVNAGAVAEIQE